LLTTSLRDIFRAHSENHYRVINFYNAKNWNLQCTDYNYVNFIITVVNIKENYVSVKFEIEHFKYFFDNYIIYISIYFLSIPTKNYFISCKCYSNYSFLNVNIL